MAHKYLYNGDFINSLGGSDVIADILLKRGLLKFINRKLGSRSNRAEYSYGEGILQWFLAQCCGAKRIENVYNHKERFRKHPRFGKFISPDTLLYMFKELAVENTYEKRTSNNEFNLNDTLNELLLNSALRLELIQPGIPYILDYDTTIIATKIRGSKYHYRHAETDDSRGYNPGVAMINKIPVFIEMRNGNTNPRTNLVKNLIRTIEQLQNNGITVDMVRVDSAGYIRELSDYLNSVGIGYITRTMNSAITSVTQEYTLNGLNWESGRLYGFNVQITELEYMFGSHKTRLILTKKPDDTLWGFTTNNWTLPVKDLISIYRQRGDCENMFRDLKQDFGWRLFPMRTIQNNSVYLYIQAFCYQMFTYLTRLFSGVLRFIRNNMRLPTFISAFMRVPTKWDGANLIIMSDDKDYSGLAGFT